MIEVEIKVCVNDKQAEALIEEAQKIKQIEFVDDIEWKSKLRALISSKNMKLKL